MEQLKAAGKCGCVYMYLSDDFGQKSSILKTDVEISLLLSIVSIPVQNDTISTEQKRYFDLYTFVHYNPVIMITERLENFGQVDTIIFIKRKEKQRKITQEGGIIGEITLYMSQLTKYSLIFLVNFCPGTKHFAQPY